MICCKDKQEFQNSVCPVCNNLGDKVKLKTVQAMVLDKSKKLDQDFSICLTPDCNVAYYGKSVTIKTNEIKEVIYSKSHSQTRTLCYCSRTSAKEILDYVTSSGNSSIKDIVNNTSTMDNSNCLINSPTGKCCSNQINKIVQEHLDK